MGKKLFVVLLLALSLSTIGCAKHAQLSHPNAINALDSTAYDTLQVAQAAIEEAKKGIDTHPFAAHYLNQAIAAYDAALPLYKVYHSMGASDPTAGTNLEQALTGLSASIAQLEKAFGQKLGGK